MDGNNLKYVYNGGIIEKVNKYLSPNEIGCYNCTRWRTGSERCTRCIKFSEFKNIDTLNSELKEKGLDYLCVSSIEQVRRKQRIGGDV